MLYRIYFGFKVEEERNYTHRKGMRHRRWSQDDRDKALKLVLANLMTVSEASREFNIPSQTFADRLKLRSYRDG